MRNTIGIFDSGVGGLTVLQYMQNQLPHTDLIFVGDNKNSPYGDKTKKELYQYASRIIEYFIKRKVEMVVFACNTTSANVLDDLRRSYPSMKMIGVIDSTVQSFLRKDKKEVLVVATKATINSNKYEDLILMYNKNIKVHSAAIPKVVPLIESGAYKKGIQDVLADDLGQYRGKVDSIILGCTHYPIITSQFKDVLGEIEYISSSESVSKEVEFYLVDHHCIDKSHQGVVEINTTGSVDEFLNASNSFYHYGDIKVKHIDV